jgi:hypothetical protein
MRSKWSEPRGRVCIVECLLSFFCCVLFAIAIGEGTGPGFKDDQMMEVSTHKDSGQNVEEDQGAWSCVVSGQRIFL